MADNLKLLLEAEKRGILPPEKQKLLDEARKRGLIYKDTLNAGDSVHSDDLDPVAPGDVMTTDDQGHIVPVNPAAQGAMPTTEVPAAPPQTTGDPWSHPALWPFQHNRQTDEWRPTVPGVVQGIGDAFALPGDVLAGKYDAELDPRAGMSNISPALIGRGLNFAATFAGGTSLPKNISRGPRALGAGEFDIPLTRGQALGDLPMLTKEEALRQGGGAPQNIMRNFDAVQREAIGTASDRIGTGLGARPESMTDSIVQSIQNKVAFSKDQAASLYQIATDGGVSFKPEMVDALPMIVDSALKDAAVTVDATLTPGAAVAMRLISEASDMAGALQPAAGVGAAGAAPSGIKGVSLDGIEQLRKQLVGLGDGANETDGRAIRAIKRSLDDWTQSAVDNMLVSGDDAALSALKQARAASSDYLKITSPKQGDAAGAAVAKMQKGGATSEEVANWLYGADVVSPTLNAPKVAERVKNIVGADSAEWNAVRSAAWERITKDMASGDMRSNTMLAKRIETFLNSKGTTLSEVLYSADERAQMQRFADALKATVTPRDATNPSRTAWTLTGAMNNITRMLSGLTAGAVTGNPAIGAATALSIPVFKGIGARRAAISAVSGPVERMALGAGPIAQGSPVGAARDELY